MSVVRAPYTCTGPGKLVYFAVDGFKMEDRAFRHHMRLGNGWLALDGCLMREWEQGKGYTCVVDDGTEKMDETSSD